MVKLRAFIDTVLAVEAIYAGAAFGVILRFPLLLIVTVDPVDSIFEMPVGEAVELVRETSPVVVMLIGLPSLVIPFATVVV